MRTDKNSIIKFSRKVGFYVKNFGLYLIPDSLYKYFLMRRFKRLSHEERLNAKIRANYYTKLLSKCMVDPKTAVAIKDFKRKVGETAKLDVNFLELTADLMKASVVGKSGTSADATYDLIESKDAIEEGDYWENIAFVGETLDGKNIIVILDNALCTSGLTLEGKNKEESVGKYTFECHADASESLTTLPYHIYYPKRS